MANRKVWTIDKAKKYIEDNNSKDIKGLTYWSAYDFLKRRQ